MLEQTLSHSRSRSLSLSLPLSRSLSLSLHSLQMEWRDLVQGTAAGSFRGRVGSFRARQKLITAVYVFTGTWKLLTLLHFGGGHICKCCAQFWKNLSVIPVTFAWNVLLLFSFCFSFIWQDLVWCARKMSYTGTGSSTLWQAFRGSRPARDTLIRSCSSSEWSVHWCSSTEECGHSCLLIEQSVCCRVAAERSVLSVTAVMFVDRTECLLPCGCRMECSECYCSHVCQQNRVSVAVWL